MTFFKYRSNLGLVKKPFAQKLGLEYNVTVHIDQPATKNSEKWETRLYISPSSTGLYGNSKLVNPY